MEEQKIRKILDFLASYGSYIGIKDLVHFCSSEDVKGYIEKKALSEDIYYEDMFSEGETPESITRALKNIVTKEKFVVRKQQDGQYIVSDNIFDSRGVLKIIDPTTLDLGSVASIAIDAMKVHKQKETHKGTCELLDKAVEEVGTYLQSAESRIQHDGLKVDVEDFASQCAKQRVESDLAQIAPGKLQEWQERIAKKNQILERLAELRNKYRIYGFSTFLFN